MSDQRTLEPDHSAGTAVATCEIPPARKEPGKATAVFIGAVMNTDVVVDGAIVSTPNCASSDRGKCRRPIGMEVPSVDRRPRSVIPLILFIPVILFIPLILLFP